LGHEKGLKDPGSQGFSALSRGGGIIITSGARQGLGHTMVREAAAIVKLSPKV